jgi:protein-S-isoprenylcysteine O-methyltransferase Ste14
MRTVTGALLGSLLFFWIAPASVAGLGPYLVSGWRMQAPFWGLPVIRLVGIAVVAAGLTALVECFVRFAIRGLGTPAPIAPPAHLVVSGLYRYVRNPMYVAVVALVVGQALILGSAALFVYAIVTWLTFHAFVVGYEEPALRRQFGTSFDEYLTHVPRWTPRLTAWREAMP